MKKGLLVTLSAIVCLSGFAQNKVTYNKRSFSAKKINTYNPREAKPIYAPKLENLEAPSPDGNSYKSFLMRQKAESSKTYPRRTSTSANKTMGDATDPYIHEGLMMYRKGAWPTGDSNFIFGGGNPLDNTMAVSNDGILMGSVNSFVWAYDLDADTTMYKDANGYTRKISFTEFAAPDLTIGPNEFPFDPKLVYDPNNDRFIMIFLSGRGPSDTKNVVGFSSTNNPLDPWHVYEITGNPQNTNHWTDYPAFAITEDELFLTVNLIEDGVSWQEGFRGTIIWQVELADGYSGAASLDMELWEDIKYDGKFIRNLNPIKGADGPLGPNMYFISNRNFDVQNDSIFLVEVTDDIASTNAVLNVEVGTLDEPYGVPPNGRQQDTDVNEAESGLQTNDARWLGGFLLDDEIQFVGNTKNFANGNAAIYHGFIKNLSGTKSFTGNIISVDSLDFGYPNMAFTGTNASSDRDAIIAFNHTSPTFHPGTSAIYYSTDDKYSDVVILKEGEDYVNKHSSPTGLSTYERWGDYFGMQRVFNDPGKVWTAGFYGAPVRKSNTWLAKLGTTPPVSTEEKSFNFADYSQVDANLFPNPVQDRMRVDFNLTAESQLSFKVFDMNGKLVADMGEAFGKPGRNQFSFSPDPIAPGIYFITILSNGEELTTKKFIKQK